MSAPAAAAPPGFMAVARSGLAHVAGAAACVAAVAWLCQGGAPLSASAWRWFTALAGDPAEARGWSHLLRGAIALVGKDLRADPLWAVQNLQVALGGFGLYLALALTWSLGRVWATLPAAVLLLVWPAARQSLATVSAESIVSTATLLVGLAAVRWHEAPRQGALLLGIGVAAATVAHPLGVLWGPGLALAALLLPVARHSTDLVGAPPRPDVPVGARWLPWLGGCLLAAALIAASVRSGGAGPWFTVQFAILRRPTEPVDLAWVSNLPAIGGAAAVALQWPLAVTWLALTTAGWSLFSARSSAVAGLAGAVAVGWLVVLIGRLPAADYLDPVVALAPATAVLAAVGVGRRLRALLANGRTAAALAWTVALLAVLGADLRVQQGSDRRSLLGHLPGALTAAEGAEPAVLGPEDVALLQQFVDSTSVLPARQGGAQLATALKPLIPQMSGRSFGAPHASNLVLLPEPAHHTVDRVFAERGTKLACTASGQRCIYRIAGRTETLPVPSAAAPTR